MNFKSLPSFITFRNLSIACAVLLVIRLIFVVMTHHKIHSAEDFLIAQNLVSGYGYTFDTNVGATALKAPVYPLFLAVCVAAFGTYAQLAAALLQHCAIAFVPLLLARLGRVWNIEFLGCLSGFLFLLHPSYFYYPNVLEVTNLFIPLFLIWGILGTRLWQEKEKKNSTAMGNPVGNSDSHPTSCNAICDGSHGRNAVPANIPYPHHFTTFVHDSLYSMDYKKLPHVSQNCAHQICLLDEFLRWLASSKSWPGGIQPPTRTRARGD
jgi:hypothetical protein